MMISCSRLSASQLASRARVDATGMDQHNENEMDAFVPFDRQR